jgi:hypothetical protein
VRKQLGKSETIGQASEASQRQANEASQRQADLQAFRATQQLREKEREL